MRQSDSTKDASSSRSIPIFNRESKEVLFAAIAVILAFAVIFIDKVNAPFAWNLIMFIAGSFFKTLRISRDNEDGRSEQRTITSDSKSG